MGYRVGLSSCSLSYSGLASALLHAEETVLVKLQHNSSPAHFRLMSSRKHGPQGRLARVGKPGVDALRPAGPANKYSQGGGFGSRLPLSFLLKGYPFLPVSVTLVHNLRDICSSPTWQRLQ